MSQKGEVLCAIPFSQTAIIFSKSDVQHPVELVLNSPMATYYVEDISSAAHETGDIVFDFSFYLASDVTLSPDHYDCLQAYPVRQAADLFQVLWV